VPLNDAELEQPDDTTNNVAARTRRALIAREASRRLSAYARGGAQTTQRRRSA
jgi:hypothetical protein